MDEKFREEKISGTTVFDGTLLEVHKDKVKLPNHETATREYINHPGAAVILPYTEDGNILMINQYRYPIEQVTLELPAGKIDPGESPEESINRELAEEAGYGADNIVKLGSIFSCVGYSNEKIHLFWGDSLYPHELESDETEKISITRKAPEELIGMIYSGEIQDAKTQIGLFWANRIFNDEKTRQQFNIEL